MVKYFSLKLILLLSILFAVGTVTAQQNSLQVNRKEIIFSAVKGTESEPETIVLKKKRREKINLLITGEKSGSFKLDSSAPKQITGKKRINLSIVFAPENNFIGIAKAKLQVTGSTGKLLAERDLRGLSLKGVEGDNEASLKTIFEILGYHVDNGWSSLANHERPELQGEEIKASYFRKAAKGKVEMIPVARFSPDFPLPFGYYTNSKTGPQNHQVGVLSKTKTHPQQSTLFPSLDSGTTSFDPGENVFGLYNNSPTHSSYTDDNWNILLFPTNASHAVRVYPVKDQWGKLIASSYLVCFEEALNGDYNDYVFLVKNIKPVTEQEEYKTLMNGKDLDGWNIFLKGRDMDTDPEHNFLLEDTVLHVSGRELGYIRTKQPFNNYHFVVEFKWGEKKWPPHEKLKRDAGICYNIPDNEPDSIWPKSIECQIQEGDVGDFWLLGFSTITVNDSTNKPANHTRMIKQNDGEKPNGEWNIVEVISYNGTCVHIVNGVVVNRGKNASVTGGRLLLQSEYAEVFYRNARIRQL
ncbi:MAG: DUF1080 domain-containing protein [Ginsengibacter sp.]